MTSSIADFYKDKNVFITGATGFLGKVLLEKLVRSCPGLTGIYVMIRPSEKQTSQDRLDKIVGSQLFERVRQEIPDFRRKLHAIAGDMAEPALGISQSETDMLLSKVNIVFHCAATVRFDEPLRTAVQLNVVGTRNMAQLCRGLEQLQAFVYVSTAYSNCDRSYIEEIIYPPPVQPQKLVDALDWMDDILVEKLTPDLVGKRPNTYTFTKACAEYLLTQEAADLPLAIVRPSIIGATWKEPFVGWSYNFSGPVGIMTAMLFNELLLCDDAVAQNECIRQHLKKAENSAENLCVAWTGMFRISPGDYDACTDLFPVDTTANMLIAVAWDTAVSKGPGNICVYNATSGGVNPQTMGEIVDSVNSFQRKYPPDDVFRLANWRVTTNSFVYQYWRIVGHVVPAYVGDVVLRGLGRKPRIGKLLTTLDNTALKTGYFLSHQWDWSHGNTDKLLAKMGKSEKTTFPFDCRDLHWPTYMENFMLGVKKYLLKEDMDNLPRARARWNRLRNIRWGFNTIMIMILGSGVLWLRRPGQHGT